MRRRIGAARALRYRVAVKRPAVLLLPFLLAGCGLAAQRRDGAAPPAAANGAAWRYVVTLSDDLATIDAALTVAGPPPRRLILGDARGLASVAHVTLGSGAATRDGEGFAIDGAGDDATIRWRVDVAKLVESRAAVRVGRTLCASPGLWLLRPQFLPARTEASVALHLPEGVTASVPWEQGEDGPYRLDETAFRWRGFTAFGGLTTHALDVAGARLEVALVDRPLAATWPGLERWLTAAARAQTSLWDGFPVPRAQIVVRPVKSNEPVPFGETQRGGGPAVVLRVGDEAADADFARDWVAVHEFAHLGMPAIADGDAWLAEGFVQYYTEVLMGRAGLLDGRGAWQEIVDGFARGARSGGGRSLAAESAEMERAHTYHRVYWGGAAIALFLDVELRRESGGSLSLDHAMREVRRAFRTGDAARRADAIPAAAIVAHLDAWLGRPLFTEVASRHLAATEFPETAATLARLGVVVGKGRVTGFDDAAPDAAVRRAILGE